MSKKNLDLPLDIHGGGQDLIFPHHENEIAQSEASTGKELARFWVHNGFVQINSEKMSKSLNNFKTIRDILEHRQPETLRFFLLGKHYRSPIDFSFEGLDDAERALKRVYECLRDVHAAGLRESWKKGETPASVLDEFDMLEKGFFEAMDDDLNTAGALGHVFGMVRLMNRILEDKGLRNKEGIRALLARFTALAGVWSEVLGVFGREPSEFLEELRDTRAGRAGIDVNKVMELMAERAEARAAKDFARSDATRDALAAMGIEVRDTPSGAVWDIA